MLLANFNGKEHLRHRAVSLRQHGFLVELKLALSFNPWAKFQTFRQLTWPPVLLGQFHLQLAIWYDDSGIREGEGEGRERERGRERVLVTHRSYLPWVICQSSTGWFSVDREAISLKRFTSPAFVSRCTSSLGIMRCPIVRASQPAGIVTAVIQPLYCHSFKWSIPLWLSLVHWTALTPIARSCTGSAQCTRRN